MAISAFSLGKFLDVRKYAYVKYLTNIVSASQPVCVGSFVDTQQGTHRLEQSKRAPYFRS